MIATAAGPYEHTGAYMDPPTSFGAHLPSKSAYANALALLIGDACGDNTSAALSLCAAYLASDVDDCDPDRPVSFEAWLRSSSSLRRLCKLLAVQADGLDALRDHVVQS